MLLERVLWEVMLKALWSLLLNFKDRVRGKHFWIDDIKLEIKLKSLMQNSVNVIFTVFKL